MFEDGRKLLLALCLHMLNILKVQMMKALDSAQRITMKFQRFSIYDVQVVMPVE